MFIMFIMAGKETNKYVMRGDTGSDEKEEEVGNIYDLPIYCRKLLIE